MRYKLLGKSGLRVSELCLGTMTFGEDWGYGASREECQNIFDTFVNAGGNFIDTANRYTKGTSEAYVGELIASERDRFIVGTKYTLSIRKGDINSSGNHRKSIIQSLEASLKRLQTDYIDIFWVHAWDQLTPVEEMMRALDDLVRSGKILYIGVSNTPSWVIAQANTLAELKGWTSFIGLQTEYNLLQRTPELDLFPMAHAFDVSILAWSPLAEGILTGKYNVAPYREEGKAARRLQDSAISPQSLAIAEEVKRISQETGYTSAQIALNWMRQSHRNIIPIVGTRNVAQMKENLACLDHPLTDDVLHRLNEITRIGLTAPHNFLAADLTKKLTYSEMLSLIDIHR